DVQGVRQAFDAALDGQGDYDLEHRLIRLDTGETRWVHAHGQVEFDESGEPLRMFGAAQDVTERHLAERELRRRNQAIESAIDGIAVLDDDERFVFLNQAIADIYGYDSPDQLLGETWEVLYDEDEVERLQTTIMPQFREEGLWRGEAVGKRGDGSTFPQEISLTAIEDEGLICVARDITQRKQAEARIRDSEERLRAVFDASPDGICALDLEGRITDCNASAADALGLGSPDDLIGERALQFVVENQREAVQERIAEALHEGSVRFVEYDVVGSDGTRFPVEGSANAIVGGDGKPVGIVSTFKDITERKRAERELQELAQFRRSIIDQANIWLHVLDRDLNNVLWNPAAAEISGISEEEALGGHRTWEIMYPDPEEREEMLGIASSIIEDGRVLENYETTIHTAEGERRSISWNARQLLGSDGEPIGLLAMGRDVSEHRELEEQLRQAVKMEAIGRLAGGIAHDFNNMLTAILGNVQLIGMRMADGDDNRRFLGEIRTAARRSADLTKQLLAFSRKQALEPEPIDLNKMIDRIEPMLERMLGEQIAVLTNLDPELGLIEADPSQIDQVLMNLVVNARDAMPDGGTLTIETNAVELDESYAMTHADFEPGPYMVLSVSDTGIGMDQETQDRIFEPFFTTKSENEGTGLGLATVYGIVSQSGGQIYVYSEPGEGTVFKVYLPKLESVEALDETEEREERDLTGRETVLLVEDEDIVRDLIAGVLRRHGHTVISAESGEEALELAAAHDGPIHIMVTDVVMPGMNGPELADAIADTQPEIPVLFVSGYTDNTIVREGVLEEGVHYLQKPFDPERLLRRIRSVIEGRD
ncbi:MAG: PAS domain S-box protein, partial [Armatimonadia bacterium]|nr:PAS domain S-box protein [Armatimonadia bacterium]